MTGCAAFLGTPDGPAILKQVAAGSASHEYVSAVGPRLLHVGRKAVHRTAQLCHLAACH